MKTPGNGGRRGRGVSSMLAVVLLLTMAATVTAMAVVFAAQARRTQAAAVGAQLRQLLAAGIPAAREELAARGPGGAAGKEVPVATPVADARLTLAIAAPSATEADVTVRAEWRGGKATETLLFTRQGAQGAWTLQDVRLGQSP
jgi:hypothetical protein